MTGRRTPDEQARIDALIDRLTCVVLADQEYVQSRGWSRKVPEDLSDYCTGVLMGIWIDAEANKQAILADAESARP